MPQDDAVLRKSLDAVERQKWFTVLVVVIAVVLAFGAFLHLAGAFHAGASVERTLQLSIIAVIFWTSGLTAVIVLQLAAMTRKVLRAIELASRRDD
ncbi:MAG: hypothetical protein U0Q11_26875 [Vicinamibacterales bacterium]